jgi:hypothetical protein
MADKEARVMANPGSPGAANPGSHREPMSMIEKGLSLGESRFQLDPITVFGEQKNKRTSF